ncbi:MAG: SH3 domain-containing protein [Hyphomicrobiaceae bacterium]|nr:SH3 domain-containing protein [Hyphomicrobiaceae bacterium]
MKPWQSNMWRPVGVLIALILAMGPAAMGTVSAAEDDGQKSRSATPGTGLPLPRFVSLKSDRVNLRSGPGTDYPTAWVYRRAGLPVEVIKEFETWRQVRDADGATGWVLQSLLSGRRTALVLPWDIKPDKPVPQVDIYSSDSPSSQAVAKVEAGVIANIHDCDGRWCQVTIDEYRGYLEQKKLWGIYENEVVK